MNATHRKPASPHELSDDQYSKRLMVDELIEQLIRRQITEAGAVQPQFTTDPGDSRVIKSRNVVPLR